MLLPWVRFRLRTVLIVLSLFVLVLPVAGIQVLRLYESALVRQTGVGADRPDGFHRRDVPAWISRGDHGPRRTQSAARQSGPRCRPSAAGRCSISPTPTCSRRFPDGRQGAAGDDVAIRVGDTLTPILQDVQTRADIRVTDYQGNRRRDQYRRYRDRPDGRRRSGWRIGRVRTQPASPHYRRRTALVRRFGSRRSGPRHRHGTHRSRRTRGRHRW